MTSSPRPEPAVADDAAEGARRDRELIDRARTGSAVAREELARRLVFVPRLVRAIDRRRGGRLGVQDLEDLTQDVLAILWRKLDSFGGVGTLERWSYRFCLLEYLNLVRKRSRRAPEGSIEGIDDPAGPAASPADDSRDQLEAALAALDPVEEEVVRLKHHGDLTFGSIADRLEIPANTAKTRYYRALGRLRRALGGGTEVAR